MYHSALLSHKLWDNVFNKYGKGTYAIRALYKYTFSKEREQLVESLLDGTYQWKIPRIGYVPKDDGSMREVVILEDTDRVVMALLTEYAYAMFEKDIHPSCVSYRKGLSVPSILHDLMGNKYKGYKVDLQKYFDTVPYTIIEKCILDMFGRSSIAQLLLDFYSDKRIYKDGKLIDKARSLCQGCAFSSILANLVLRNIDEIMYKECAVYYRYSDDILILSDKDTGEEEFRLLTSELDKIGLSINISKLDIIDGEYTFLGGKIGTNYVHWSDRKRAKLKHRVKEICKSAKGKDFRTKQRNAIRRIQHMLLKKKDGYSYFEMLANLAIDDLDCIWLSKYCKDAVRAIATGKSNFTHNRNVTSDELLKDLGWVNLDYLWKCYKTSREVYDIVSKNILSKKKISETEFISADSFIDYALTEKLYTVDLANQQVKIGGINYTVLKDSNPNLPIYIKKLWPLAKLYPYRSPFNTEGDGFYDLPFSRQQEVLQAHKRLLSILITSRYNMNSIFEVVDDFILLHDWVK